mmetsp:Transcript_13692/g.49089  ORF Transcript_13692/g.49089 Transcript_13692/m.49089 type:complete len:225 (-) Transcript_13692:213-887(-)
MSANEKSGHNTSAKHSTACLLIPQSVKSDSRVSPDVRTRRSTATVVDVPSSAHAPPRMHRSSVSSVAGSRSRSRSRLGFPPGGNAPPRALTASLTRRHSLCRRASLTIARTNEMTPPPALRASKTDERSSSVSASPRIAARRNAGLSGSGRMWPSRSALPKSLPMKAKRFRAASLSGVPGGAGAGNRPFVCQMCSGPLAPSSSMTHVGVSTFPARDCSAAATLL